MNLTNESIESTYGNLLTIGSTAGTPTQGTLQNGAGQDITKIVVDEIEANKIIQTQTTVAANGTTLSSGTILGAGVSLVTSSSSSNISVKLPAPQLGLIISIVNTSTRDIYVFPNSSSSSIANLPAGDYYTIPADNLLYQFLCVQNPSVGNWSVATPSQNSGVTRTYTLSMVADGTYGGNTSVSHPGTYNPQLSGPFGVSPNLVYYLQSPAPNVDFLNAPEFDTYTQHRIVARTVTSNIPAGDLTTNPSQATNTLMNITYGQLGSIDSRIRIGSQVLTPANGSSLSVIDQTLFQFNDFYSLNWNNNPSSLGLISHYQRGATLCQQNVVPTPNATWIDNKMNKLRRIYYQPRLQYGDSSNPASGFPSGFSFECELSLTFEFR